MTNPDVLIDTPPLNAPSEELEAAIKMIEAEYSDDPYLMEDARIMRDTLATRAAKAAETRRAKD